MGGYFTVCLGSMNGDVNTQWLLGRSTHVDIQCNRTYLVGFNPYEALMDNITSRNEFTTGQDRYYVMNSLFQKLFRL